MTRNLSNSVVISHVNKKEMKDSLAEELFNVANAGFQEDSPWTLHQIENTLTAHNSLIIYAAVNQEMVGFIIASEDIEMIDIYIVVVAEAFKQQAIGTKLFEYLMDYSQKQGIKAIVLETRKSNAPAIKLYERVGFKKVGLRRAYYSSPIEDAIVMKREL